VSAVHRLTTAEQAVVLLARGVVALPPRAKRVLAGRPIEADGHRLDLDTQLAVRLDRARPRSPGAGTTAEQAREETRQAARLVAGVPVPMAEVTETTVAGGAGPLRARLYVPPEAAGTTRGPLLVFFHGGGNVAGDIDTHDAPCRLLAAGAGVRVLSVDYRLAPEHPFPAAVDDALAAFRDVAARPGAFGADPARLAVGGDSAGGRLAAVVAQHDRPAFQLLIYPATDNTRVYPSERLFAEGFFLTKESMDWYEDQFLPPGTDPADPRVSPLLAPDLSGVAPALVVTAGFDPLRDEGEAYAARLRAAGVHAVTRRFPGFVHGFLNAVGVGRGGREAVLEIAGALRMGLA